MLHSCENIMELLPDLIEICLDGLNPPEAKAGMDLVDIKGLFGDKLVLQGGIHVRTMSLPGAIEEEGPSKLAVAKEGGGYIYHSDHSVPDDVTFADYCRVIALVRNWGA